jgi:hypothetical protein
MVVVIVIIWTLTGLIAGGMLGSALADARASHGGDIDTLLVGLLFGAAAGATGSGYLGLWLGRRFANNRHELLAATLVGIIALVAATFVFEKIRT